MCPRSGLPQWWVDGDPRGDHPDVLGRRIGSKRVDLELRGTLASVAVLVATLVLLKGCLLVLPIDGLSKYVTRGDWA